MKIRLLDRYVLSELLYPFVFGVAAFSSIFIASSMLFKLVQYMTNYGASGIILAKLFMYSLPEVINYTFPMSMLLSSLMAFGKLSGSSEIVAMKSGGVSYYRIVAPVLVVGFLVSMFSVIWAEKVVPPAKTEASRIIREDIRGNVKPKSQENIVIKTISGEVQRITYARTFDEKEGRMTNVAIEEIQHDKVTRIQMAKEALWQENQWLLKDGTLIMLDEKDGVSSKVNFAEQIIPLKLSPTQVSWEQKDIDQMSIGELRGYREILKKQHQPYSDPETEIYMRFAIPMASFFFAMLGAPLGTQKQRTSSSIGLGISIIVIFIYYAIMAFTSGLGRGGVIFPWLAAMIPNLVCLAVGVFLLKQKNY
jgi:lipopolysaccharide export system permease protein